MFLIAARHLSCCKRSQRRSITPRMEQLPHHQQPSLGFQRRFVNDDVASGFNIHYWEEREHAFENMAVREHEQQVMEELKKDLELKEETSAAATTQEPVDSEQLKKQKKEKIMEDMKKTTPEAEKQAFEKAKQHFSGSV